jgi:hypothetical protein
MILSVLLRLGLVLVVTACGSTDGVPGAYSPAPSTRLSSPHSPAPTSTFAEDMSSTSSLRHGRVITVRGTVARGVEAGCLMLTEAEGSWLLVGQTAGLKAGDTVTVRGSVVDDLATTCQQGLPLWVDEVLAR